MIWGWMQVGNVIPLHHPDDKNKQWTLDNPKVETWMKYHPHFAMKESRENTLYIGNKDLRLDDKLVLKNGGAGSFQTYRDELQLTVKGSNLTDWILPSCFYSEDAKKRLSYHPSNDAWRLTGDQVSLRAASIGQEFVMDCEDNPEAIQWVTNLITNKHN